MAQKTIDFENDILGPIGSLKGDLSNKVDKNGYGEVSEKNTTFFVCSENIFNKEFTHDGYYGSNGWWFNDSTWQTIIIRVEPNKEYSTHAGLQNEIVYFKNGLEEFGFFKIANTSGLVLSGNQTDEHAWDNGQFTFTTPENCYYVAMACLKTRNLLDELMVVAGDTYPTEYIKHKYFLHAEREEDAVNNRKIARLEDDSKFALYKNPHSNYFAEPYRPQYHLSGESGWMNDINGFVKHNGLYHVYYQYQEGSVGRSNIGWGHAVSDDLVIWKHRKPALIASHPLKQIWSGCCVVDENNISGYGTNTILSYYTLYDNQTGSQEVHMAYSHNGDEFTDIPNAILPTEENLRDPNIIYDSVYDRWLMVVASSGGIRFYKSNDLSTWYHVSTIALNCECPLLMEHEGSLYLFISSYEDGELYTKLSITETTISMPNRFRFIDGHKAGFTGSYGSNILHADGKNYLASWMQAPDRSNFVNTLGHSGSMSLVKEIAFDTNKNLIQKPVIHGIKKVGTYLGRKIYLPENKSRKIHANIKHSGSLSDNSSVVLNIMGGVVITYKLKSGDITIDRSSVPYCGDKQYYSNYTSKIKPIILDNEHNYSLDIFIDKCNLEIFFNNGINVISETVYSDGRYDAWFECTEDIMLEIEDFDVPYTLDDATHLNTNVKLSSDYIFSKQMKDTVCGRTISAGGYYTFKPTNSNFTLCFDVRQLGENCIDIMVGSDVKNCICATLVTKDARNGFHVHKYVDGAKTWLGNGIIELARQNGNLKDYDTHKFKMVVSETKIDYYFDDLLVHSIDDAINNECVIIKSANVQSCTIQNMYYY